MASSVLARSAQLFHSKASGELSASPAWTYSLLVDDVIARLSEIDRSLGWTQGTSSADAARVIEQLAWLTRERRMEIGQWLFERWSAIWLMD